MTHRKKFGLLAGVCATLLVAAGLCFHSLREPSHAGKPLTAWLRQYQQSMENAHQLKLLTEPQQLRFMGFYFEGDSDYARMKQVELRQAFRDKLEAEAAVRTMGADAVSYLRNLIDERESRLVRLRRIIYRTFKIKELDRSEGDRLARLGLGLIGPDAAPAVEALLQRLEQEPVLTCWALGQIGPAAQSAVPALRSGLTNTTTTVRRPCVYALAQIMTNHQDLIPILVKQLDDPITVVAAAYQLGQLGPRASSAVPALRRVGAWEALRAIADERQVSLGKLEQQLGSKLYQAQLRDWAVKLMNLATPADHSLTWALPGLHTLEPPSKIFAVPSQVQNPRTLVVLWGTAGSRWGAVFTDPGAEYQAATSYEQWKHGDGVWSILEKQ
jgi:hypothetical protein